MRPADVTELAQLVEPLRSTLTAVLQAAGDKVWIVSGRRSIEEQVALRREHCGTSWADIWTKPSSQCSPPTAIPGRSKHETGQAADLGGDVELAARLGKGALIRPVDGENWHFQAAAGALGQIDNLEWPDGWPSPIDIATGGVSKGIGSIFGDGVEDAIGNVLSKATEPFLVGLRRIALVGLLITGGVALVVMGGVRGTNLQGAQ